MRTVALVDIKQKEGEKVINTNKIKGRIIEMGYTQADGAKCLNIAQPTFSQKINNLRSMDLDEAEKIMTWLQIPMEEFGVYFFYTQVAQCNS